jgi:hypothetical protein
VNLLAVEFVLPGDLRNLKVIEPTDSIDKDVGPDGLFLG